MESISDIKTVSQVRTYERTESAVFSKTKEAFGGLSNMAAGFPVRVNVVHILTSEALYQACRFPHLPDVQRLIIQERSPMTAKMRGKPYRAKSRPDWDQVRVKIMRWCLRVKLIQNFDTFSRLLLDTGARPIVELSRKDDFWGAKQRDDDTLVGINVLGRLLMELREELRSGKLNESAVVEPLDIPDFLFLGKPIGPIHRVANRSAVQPDFVDDIRSQSLKVEEPATHRYGSETSEVARSESQATVPAGFEERRRETSGRYPKRLIEVDLPIKRISAHSRREKNIRHGHISTLHIWWARRPLAACRAVICAALWPDPVDVTPEDVDNARKEGKALELNTCPSAFRDKAMAEMRAWTSFDRQMLLSPDSRLRFEAARKNPAHFGDPLELRGALLDFIADFANWDNSTVREYLDTSRALTQAAHEALGGAPGTRPLVVDPFAGGGSIPLEALRVGADAFASDLNPIPVLLNKVVLEYIPKYGQRLADEVRKWGEWIKREAEKELAEFYPKDADGATPIAYLWARTIRCEGPGCGAEVPLIRSLWLAKKGKRLVALRLVPNPKAKRVDFQILVKQRDGWVDQANLKGKIEEPKFDGMVKRGSATCPCCGYTTPVGRVREQLKARHGGGNDARLYCVVTTRDDEQGRFYRLPSETDVRATQNAAIHLEHREAAHRGDLSLVPDEPTPSNDGHRAVASVVIYGMTRWGDIFSPRQLFMLTTIVRLVQQAGQSIAEKSNGDMAKAVETILACALDREAEHSTTLCRWNSTGQKMQATFGRQAIPMLWDYCETNPFGGSVGSWESVMECVLIPFETGSALSWSGHVERVSAVKHPLPNDAAHAFVTDPPYYDSIPYADLADFFFVWLKRTLRTQHPDLFGMVLTPKEEQAIVWHPNSAEERQEFERKMCMAMSEGRRVLAPSGIGIVVFAHKSTSGWETQLQAMIDGGWTITGSWPVDTEMGTRMNAMGTASLASSVHLVCRPRENPDGSVRAGEIGDWRDVLQELPRRIHEWMPRLAEEGVVGADAIFACLGPALEIFSRYSRVEKASGETVTLREYLEYVWAAVAKEALSIVFPNADTASFEPDARLTAMWLWTLNAGATSGAEGESDGEESDDEDDAKGKGGKTKGGFVLEYDAARKIAQGLGANLEDLKHVIEVSGETARLLPVSERTQYLFGKDQAQAPSSGHKKKAAQMDLFGELAQAGDSEAAWGEKTVQRVGETTLDRIHQSMILFATGRGEALKRFLVDGGAGRDQRFWRLAQALSALYPTSASEKRWVDGVLARKKGLGL